MTQDLVTRCLNDQIVEGRCGPEDPWDEALGLTNSDPEQCWNFITDFCRMANTAEQFAKLGAGPLDYFWTEHHESFLPRLREIAAELPQLVNLLVADDRRSARAADVMNLVYVLAKRDARVKRQLKTDFEHEPPPELKELTQPRKHPMTEALWLPNWQSFQLDRNQRAPVSDERLAEIVEGYVRAPSPPDDDEEEDWWWALNDLVNKSPEQAWIALLRIISREEDGVDLSQLGAGALETLISSHAEELLEQIETELESNPRFVRAFSSCYLFDLSETTLSRLAQKCRKLLFLSPPGGETEN